MRTTTTRTAMMRSAMVAAASMDITTAATGKRPKNETTVKATMELLVDVNVSGLLD